MRLIFIYGPPAAGKLAVSKELKKLTGYRIFHNHLTLDLLSHLFTFGAPGFFRMSEKLRLMLIEEAAKRGVDTVFTFCYDYPHDDGFIKKVIGKVDKHGGTVHFVHLYCSKGELLRRVKHASRESFDKIRSKRKLSRTLKCCDFFTPIPFVENLRIDNTKVPARKSALRIMARYRLGR